MDDRDDLLVLWSPKGTIRKIPTVPTSRKRAGTRAERLMSCLVRQDWVFADSEWDVSTLWLTKPGAMHSTWVSFLEDGTQWGWYVNLQRPVQRTARGIQTMDLMLDVLIEPDCSSWRWKDKDEFDAMVEWGLIDGHEAEAVRAEASEVVRRANAMEPPFCEPWGTWRPDPDWPLPSLGAVDTLRGRS